MIPLIKKYAPKTENDVFGQDLQVKKLKNFLSNFKSAKKKAVLLHGRPGCGKTSSLYAISNDMDLEVIELNASDLRNKDGINSVLGAASQQMSLFMKQKVILVDEVDGIAGRADYGGLGEIVKLIDKTSFPLVLTANDPYHNKFSKLRKKCEMIEFNELDNESMFKLLEKIRNGENIACPDDLLKRIARRNAGDLRGAVNDFQILSAEDDISKDDVDSLSGRDRVDTMLNALMKVFKTTDPEIARTAFDNVSENFDDIMLWLDFNIPLEYKNPADICRAYDCMSRADMYKGRIRRWQHWRFLVYINTLISAGIAVSKDEKNRDIIKYKPTGRILKMWWAKQKSMKKKAIAEKIAIVTHNSTKRVLQDIDLYKQMFKDEGLREKLTDEFDLDSDQVKWILK